MTEEIQNENATETHAIDVPTTPSEAVTGNEPPATGTSDTSGEEATQEVAEVQLTLSDVTNPNVTIQYPIPTPGVEVTEKGKHIEPISLPNTAVQAMLADPYWAAILLVHSSNGLDFVESNTDEMRTTRARVKRYFEQTFAKTFTEADYLLIHQINSATDLLYTTNNLGADKRDPFLKEGANFEQGIRDSKGNLKSLGGAAQLSGKGLQSEPLTGPRAALELGLRLGYGTNGNYQLPNSGISIAFNNPSNSELFNLDEFMDEEKVNLGLVTLGYFYGANGTKLYNAIVNFILNKVVTMKPTFATVAEMRKHIKVTDIQMLAAALCNIMYPDGYPFATYDAHSKTEINHGLIKPLRCVFVDNNLIPDGCKRILEKSVINPIDIVEYQHELEASFKNQFLVIGEDTIPTLFKFKVPNLEEYEKQSNIWIDFITGLVSADRTELSPRERKDIYSNHVNAAIASQYLPYVDYVYLLTEEEANSEAYKEGRYAEIVDNSDRLRKVSNPEDILLTLNTISSDSQLTEQFVEAVALYRDSANVYTIGVPEVLTAEQMARMNLTPEEIEYYHKHPKMIPIDAVTLFFHLRARRFNSWSIVPTRRVKK